MSSPGDFHRAGFFGFTPISDVTLCAQIPDFTCPVCGRSSISSWFSYPHLNAHSVLSSADRKRLGPVVSTKATNEEIIRLVRRLRENFGVPITAGTIFGPTSVKVTAKPAADLHVLVNHAGLFCRRPAAERLWDSGLRVQWVKSPASGRYAADADYVEFAVPVMAHQQLPIDVSFCEACLRPSADGSFAPTLLAESLPTTEPFFRTFEQGLIVFSAEFVQLLKRLSITGFVEGQTLLPVGVVERTAYRPSLAELERQNGMVRQARWRKLVNTVEAEFGE